MAIKCLHPIPAWLCGAHLDDSGNWANTVVFSFPEVVEYCRKIGVSEVEYAPRHEISVPCGKCAACQLAKRKDMATRITHEASMHEELCYITLTYNDDSLPCTDYRKFDDPGKVLEFGAGRAPAATLCIADVQKFLKRLRRHLEYKPKKPVPGRDHCDHPIRYFAVGEYGGRTHRPHYHLIIFGWRPSDLKYWKSNEHGQPIYRSAQLEKLWPFGFSTVEDVSPFVCRYCARYVTKKFTRSADDPFYDFVVPEFALQSKKDGGIGASWFDKFADHVMSVGFATVRVGPDKVCKISIPKYYISRCKKLRRRLYDDFKDAQLAWLNSHVGTYSLLDHARACESILYQCRLQDAADKV